MKTSFTLPTRSGLNLLAETDRTGEDVEITLQGPSGKACLLHWGVRDADSPGWTLPPSSLWPPGTQQSGAGALETPFSPANRKTTVVIRLRPAPAEAALEFVLFFPEEKRWDNNGGRNYQVPLAEGGAGGASPLETLRAHVGSAEVSFERVFDLEDRRQLAVAAAKKETDQPWVGLPAEAGVPRAFGTPPLGGRISPPPKTEALPKKEGRYRVYLAHNLPGEWLLHWGIARRSPHEWLLPPETALPPGTKILEQRAAETLFTRNEGVSSLQLEFAEAEAPLGLQFVLRRTDGAGRWLNYRGGNFYVPVLATRPATSGTELGALADIAEEIIRVETTHNSWTLMHRFNLCHDLLDRVQNNLDGLALLYVWLRFSAIRQLTWQRNYNTKPRELAHAQDRLTQKLAGMYRGQQSCRPVLRLMLATVGRGGEGQRIRDEILNIMHRHHVKEVSGHFLEEWHQKLHNNTTPDDIVICEAYLEFLRSNGNQDRFYQVLEAGGVSPQRLESFERPIRSRPDFVPHLKEGLIHDFSQFLRVLKAAHAGTDFETAANTARGRLDGEMQGLVDWIGGHRRDDAQGLLPLVTQITEARRRLSQLLHQSDAVRELLYLDLALEQLLRGAVERNIHLRLGGDHLADLIERVLENVTFSFEDPELAACSHHWQRLQAPPRFGPEWSLHAKAVTDRAARSLAGWIDRFYQLLQPKAEHLGHGFQAEAWTITLFSEEVVRGNSLGFVLSMLLHQLDPLLRQAARLSAWQIISRGSGAGKLEVVGSLRSLQRQRFANPVVVVADQVAGDEEIPEGVTAVIAPDVTDVVSHVAVRARNGNVLFAACHDPDELERLKTLRGHNLKLEVTASGDVRVQEAAPGASEPHAAKPHHLQLTPRHFTKFAVSSDEFDEQTVGSKSLHQVELRGKLPEWIGLPASAAVPFGVFEKTLLLQINQSVAGRYLELVQAAQQGEAAELAALRETVGSLAAPSDLKSSLTEAMARAGLAMPPNWETVWNAIKRVWASKWNDRAFLSRQKMGLAHESLSMSVLIQQVVPANYAFVIHTVNPATGDANQLFAEVVLGLGETLVGNYPGRAMSFVAQKDSSETTILSFPSKSIALYGGGLIFRSDSNGEDLPGYAGAGLYDSILLDPPRQAILDYAQEPLVWDETFRRGLLASITKLGLEVERACGPAQDIEGAVAQGRFYLVQNRPQAGA